MKNHYVQEMSLSVLNMCIYKYLSLSAIFLFKFTVKNMKKV